MMGVTLWVLTALAMAGENVPEPPHTAHAHTPFTVQAVPEAVLTVGSLLTWGILDGLVKPSLGGGLPCRTIDNGTRCDPMALGAIDRRTYAYQSVPWAKVSDAGQALALAGTSAAVIADALIGHHGRPFYDAGVDFLVLTETFALGTAINQVLKYAVRRPRPQLYLPDSSHAVEAELSFPSGHTTAVATSMAAWSTIFMLRHPHSVWRWAPLGVSAAVTGTVAYGRVATGKHFPTDVLAAAISGGAVGYFLPMIHRRLEHFECHVIPQNSGTGAPVVRVGLHHAF
jgi:membrane-associated phospholipid phosphatase